MWMYLIIRSCLLLVHVYVLAWTGTTGRIQTVYINVYWVCSKPHTHPWFFINMVHSCSILKNQRWIENFCSIAAETSASIVFSIKFSIHRWFLRTLQPWITTDEELHFARIIIMVHIRLYLFVIIRMRYFHFSFFCSSPFFIPTPVHLKPSPPPTPNPPPPPSSSSSSPLFLSSLSLSISLSTLPLAFSSRWFMVTIVTGLIGVVMEAIASIVFFIVFFAARDQLRYFCNVPGNASACDPGLKILGASVPDPVFPSVTAVLALLAVIAIMLIGHLTCFHFYLSKTYTHGMCAVEWYWLHVCLYMCRALWGRRGKEEFHLPPPPKILHASFPLLQYHKSGIIHSKYCQVFVSRANCVRKK